MVQLTDEERRAVATLKRLARRWPKSLWLFAASGKLHVMRCNRNGTRAMHRGGVDAHFVADTIDIPNDGGDW